MKKSTLLFSFLLTFISASLAQKDATEFLELAEKEIGKKNYRAALDIASEAIVKFPDSTRLYDFRGNLFSAFQEYDKAIQDFSLGYKTAQNDKYRAHFLMNRGGIRSKVRDFEGAYNDLILAVQFDSTNLDAYSNLSAACDEVGKIDEAFKYSFKILSIEPKHIPALINLGFKYQSTEEHEKAIEYFNKAAKIDKNQPLIYSNRSFSKLKNGDIGGAQKDIEKSLKMMPSNSYAYKIQALIYLEKGETKVACETLFEANKRGYAEQFGSEVNDLMRKHCN